MLGFRLRGRPLACNGSNRSPSPLPFFCPFAIARDVVFMSYDDTLSVALEDGFNGTAIVWPVHGGACGEGEPGRACRLPCGCEDCACLCCTRACVAPA